MKKIQSLVILSALVFAGMAFAGDKKDMTLEEKKAMVQTYLDKKVELIQQAKTCVEGADSKDKVKECKKNMKKEMKAMKKGKGHKEKKSEEK